MAVNGLRLFGVVLLSGGQGPPLPEHPYSRTRTMLRRPAQIPATSLISYREIGAVVGQSPFASVKEDDDELVRYRETIDANFEKGTIYPAPFGTVFRSADLVERWLEMNYIALAEGIHFVHGRCEARVHITESEDGKGKKADRRAGGSAPDIPGISAECFRALRRHATAAVALKTPEDLPNSASSAFLIGRPQWDEFGDQVAEQARRYLDLSFETTGPWPPYDFVRMDIGA
ncbi:MAG: GvpL/GvpF family gas vesicle protein [Gemmatimonadaceae bacterium]